MKLDEAIKNNKALKEELTEDDIDKKNTPLALSLQLGIEALERLKQLRHYSDLNIRDLTLKLLPSETKGEK